MILRFVYIKNAYNRIHLTAKSVPRLWDLRNSKAFWNYKKVIEFSFTVGDALTVIPY